MVSLFSFSSDDPVKFREDLMNIARTTLSSKILTQYKDHFANLAVDAILRLKVMWHSLTGGGYFIYHICNTYFLFIRDFYLKLSAWFTIVFADLCWVLDFIL